MRLLANLEEARDLLLSTSTRDGLCIAVFRFGAVALSEEIEPKLRELVGREVSCLRLDNKFYIREVRGHG